MIVALEAARTAVTGSGKKVVELEVESLVFAVFVRAPEFCVKV